MLKFNTETPILLLVFNGPTLTEQVLERIRVAAPKYLYVAADGPRSAGEKVKTDAVRAIFKKIDWDCKLVTLFRTQNLGCGKAVSEGVTWFFDKVEGGIIFRRRLLARRKFFFLFVAHY